MGTKQEQMLKHIIALNNVVNNLAMAAYALDPLKHSHCHGDIFNLVLNLPASLQFDLKVQTLLLLS